VGECDSLLLNVNVLSYHAVCTNTNGSYYCNCEPGYQTKDKKTFNATQGVKCHDINECEYERCGENATCHNTSGSFYCTCDPGYRLESGQIHFTNGSCKHEDECGFENPICGDHAVCNNTNGGYYCNCAPGYQTYPRTFNFTQSSSKRCRDIDECSEVKDLCGPNSKCNNAVGSYFCTYKPGFKPSNDKKTLNATQGVKCHGKMFVSDGFLNNNRKVTALLSMIEHALKLLGYVLQDNITKKSVQTYVTMLVNRSEVAPDGPLVLSASDIQLQSDWATAAGDSYLGIATVSLLSYTNLHTLVNNYFHWLETQQAEKFKINSRVVTVVVTNPHTANLKKPIILTFSHLEVPVGNQTCVFWDSNLDGGAWSSSGCTVVKSSNNHTVCSCTHLSSFAVLMALYEQEDIFELQLITWVGLSLSLVCLFISILTFGLIRSIQSTRTTIHLHLCISLFIADLIFLTGITQTENQVGCAFVAGLLHYFFLAAFCWMCLEGVQLFRMVVLVFNTTLRPLYMIAGGYGVPALIVAVSAAVHAKGYGTRRHCWLSLDDGFIWSFFGPVCVIIVVNAIFFLITVWKLAEKFSSLSQDLSKLHKIKTFTITAIAQLCVLGTMWIFGCFQFDEGMLALSFLFTILNSLQGVLVFTMHCLLSRQVRDEYIKILRCICEPQKRTYTEFSTNQFSKSQHSLLNTGEKNRY
uniref:Si:ch211-241f5.3 n=1 Tax=Electrophorus electricus TaxID=8005 RepID=A0A4W4H199_ELEEL